LGVGLTIVGKPPRNSAGFFWRRPRPKLGCGAKEISMRQYCPEIVSNGGATHAFNTVFSGQYNFM
jgi:hypothetical protein